MAPKLAPSVHTGELSRLCREAHGKGDGDEDDEDDLARPWRYKNIVGVTHFYCGLCPASFTQNHLTDARAHAATCRLPAPQAAAGDEENAAPHHFPLDFLDEFVGTKCFHQDPTVRATCINCLVCPDGPTFDYQSRALRHAITLSHVASAFALRESLQQQQSLLAHQSDLAVYRQMYDASLVPGRAAATAAATAAADRCIDYERNPVSAALNFLRPAQSANPMDKLPLNQQGSATDDLRHAPLAETQARVLGAYHSTFTHSTRVVCAVCHVFHVVTDTVADYFKKMLCVDSVEVRRALGVAADDETNPLLFSNVWPRAHRPREVAALPAAAAAVAPLRTGASKRERDQHAADQLPLASRIWVSPTLVWERKTLEDDLKRLLPGEDNAGALADAVKTLPRLYGFFACVDCTHEIAKRCTPRTSLRTVDMGRPPLVVCKELVGTTKFLIGASSSTNVVELINTDQQRDGFLMRFIGLSESECRELRPLRNYERVFVARVRLYATLTMVHNKGKRVLLASHVAAQRSDTAAQKWNCHVICFPQGETEESKKNRHEQDAAVAAAAAATTTTTTTTNNNNNNAAAAASGGGGGGIDDAAAAAAHDDNNNNNNNNRVVLPDIEGFTKNTTFFFCGPDKTTCAPEVFGAFRGGMALVAP